MNQEEWLEKLVNDIKNVSSDLLKNKINADRMQESINELKLAMPVPTSITNDTLYEIVKSIKEDMQDAKEERKEIKDHVERTNGRVGKLEIWRGVMLGGLGVLSTVFTGLIIPIIYNILTK